MRLCTWVVGLYCSEGLANDTSGLPSDDDMELRSLELSHVPVLVRIEQRLVLLGRNLSVVRSPQWHERGQCSAANQIAHRAFGV